MPAVMPADNWLPARDGPMSSTVTSSWKAIGSEPNFRLVARPGPRPAMNPPLIWALPSVITAEKYAEEMTTPSRVIAKVLDWSPTRAWLTSRSTLAPVPSRERLTAQDTSFCGIWALAPVSEVPSMIAFDSRYFWPSSSHVISGTSGLSFTCGAVPSAGQENLVNAADRLGCRDWSARPAGR